jgi:hypothetical protein
MLQRIYGTAWRDKKELKAYLHRLEEAEKRDHRRLGKQLDLFHFQDEAPGMAFWHHKGRVIYREVEQYMRDKLDEYGYRRSRRRRCWTARSGSAPGTGRSSPTTCSRRTWTITTSRSSR